MFSLKVSYHSSGSFEGGSGRLFFASPRPPSHPRSSTVLWERHALPLSVLHWHLPYARRRAVFESLPKFHFFCWQFSQLRSDEHTLQNALVRCCYRATARAAERHQPDREGAGYRPRGDKNSAANS